MILTIFVLASCQNAANNEELEKAVTENLAGKEFSNTKVDGTYRYFDIYTFNADNTGERYAEWTGSDARTFAFSWEIKVSSRGKIKLICRGKTYEYEFLVETNSYNEPIALIDEDDSRRFQIYTAPSTPSYSHTCEECDKKATHSFKSPFSRETEWYCDKHYKELQDMLDDFGIN